MAKQTSKPKEQGKTPSKPAKKPPKPQALIHQVEQVPDPTGDALQMAQEHEAGSAASSEAHQAEMLNDPRIRHDSAGVLRSRYINMLRVKHGNAHVQRVVDRAQAAKKRGADVQRDSDSPDVQRESESFPILSWLDRQRHNVMEATGLESTDEAERGRATAFYAHGTYGPQSVIGAGGRGGFDVTYDPSSGIERITIKGGVQFLDGLTVSGGTITPQNAGLQGAANQAMGLSGPERAAFVAQYQWTPAEKTPWVTSLRDRVQTMWGSSSTGLSFFINKPQWDWITANVQVQVNLRAMEAGDARASDDHLLVNTVKEPPGGAAGQGTGAEVAYGTGSNAFDQTMTLSSQDINPRTDNMLRLSNTVTFGHDSYELTDAAKGILNTWIATYQGAPGNAASNPTQVTVNGYTSASGSEEYNLDLGLKRTNAVKDYLKNNGFTNVDSRVMELSFGEGEADPASTAAAQERERRVELIVDSGDAQVVAAHEFGHTFGLGDEYATGAGSAITGTGAAAGTAAGHDALTKSMTDESGANLPGAIHENNEGIMSLGNAVRPQHYSTFHKALTEVTGESQWSVRS